MGNVRFRLGGGGHRFGLRFAGRLSVSLLEPETTWFNKGTYLGNKKVLSLGLGYDTQEDLTLNNREDTDNAVWTADVFFDHPVGDGAVTLEAAYIDIEHCTQDHNFSMLSKGDDAQNWYINAGYLLPGGLFQPYVRYETVDVDHQEYESRKFSFQQAIHTGQFWLLCFMLLFFGFILPVHTGAYYSPCQRLLIRRSEVCYNRNRWINPT